MGRWGDYQSYSRSGGMAGHSRKLAPGEGVRSMPTEDAPSKSARSRKPRRPPATKPYHGPVEVFRPVEDGDEIREQVSDLMVAVVGGTAVAEGLRSALNDETRRSVLIQRTGDALRRLGLSDDELIVSAQRLSDLTAPEPDSQDV